MSLRHTANPHPSDGDVGEFYSQPLVSLEYFIPTPHVADIKVASLLNYNINYFAAQNT